MFGSLFETEEDGEETLYEKSGKKLKQGVSKLRCPPEPRGKTRICGLQNQGATCYLNSLLQTLFFTPELRDGLFQLRAEDLNHNPYSDLTSSKAVRVIPLQLQKLFAKLLLLNQDSINTTDLTDSFGWKGNEGFQQHDVQELNRILFSALESSLVGTPGEALIRKLYHGTSVTKVICKECGYVSEREEDYLDLPLILSGCSDLEQSLSMSYVTMETLEGANQYRCGSCGKLVNAAKGSKIRTLPPILTFSLLRFDYDFQRGERFKETKRYTFPNSLNMKTFCESNGGLEDDQDYELFSVVIHGGSCYGGHYHAYIHDMEGLGMWSEPSNQQVKIVQDDNGLQDVVVNSGNPVELISALLKKLGGSASVNQLCQCMSKETGMSWNKRFKSHFGPLSKFFKKNSDVFSFSDICGWVSLKNGVENSKNSGSVPVQTEKEHSSFNNDFTGKNTPSPEAGDERGHFWFDLNDSRISCIHERDLQHQFAGKESAYMLFYRRKNLLISGNDPTLSVPSVLRAEVEEMNKQLTKQREDYDVRLNQISVSVHFGDHYTVADGLLRIKQGLSSEPLIISLDRRNTVTDLIQKITELDSVRDNVSSKTLHIARQLPSGLHLFEELTQHPQKSLVQSGVYDGTEVFLWNGEKVDGCKVYTGEDTAPVLLNITYLLPEDQEAVEVQKTFRKDTTVGEMKLMLCNSIGISYQDLLLSWVRAKGKISDAVSLNSEQDGDTLNEVCLQDGDHLVAEKKVLIQSSVKSMASLASQESEKHASIMVFEVENRCVATETQEGKESNVSWPVYPVEILQEQTIGDLKIKALRSQSQNQQISETACRLRVDDDLQGLSAPLYDHETVGESWLKEGQRLVLQLGAPLLQEEIMIRYYVCSPTHTREEMEQIVNKKITVGECLQVLMANINLEGMAWHLRKTNWTGEPADSLDNEDETLENEHITNGETLIIEEGRLPPKGFIRLSLWQSSGKTKEQSSEGVLYWIASGVQGLLGSALTTETSESMDDESEDSEYLFRVGDIEISQEASLYDLKLLISTLPQLAGHVIPTPGFVRLQEVVDRQLTRVLRGLNRTMRQLKLTSSTQLSVRILQHEEDLSPSTILLKIKKRIPGERWYFAEQEVIFEPSEGATPVSLRQFISRIFDIPLDRLNVAKYLRAKYDWLVITDKPKSQTKNKGAKKKINLRQSPFHLQDGDIIGVKDCHLDPDNKDDFSTPADDEGKERLRREEEEKKQRRKNKRARRPEVPLSIHVDDFR